MKIKGLITLLVALSMFACKADNHKFKLNGVVDGMNKDLAVLQLGDVTISDTVKVKNGKFEISLPSIESDKYTVKFINHGIYMPVVLNNGSVRASADVDEIKYNHLQKVHVSGVKYYDLLRIWESSLDSVINTYDDHTKELYYKYLKPGEKDVKSKEKREAITYVMKNNPTMEQDLSDWRYKFILENVNDYFMVDLLYNVKGILKPGQLATIASKIPERLKNHAGFAKMKTYLEESKNVSIGSIAPEFTIKDINGKDFSLNSLRGNYVILDFWASWCAPCREAFPHVKALRKLYEKENLKVVSISIDKNENAWKKASVKENIDWINLISNTKSENSVDKKYLVEAIPTIILIGKDGKIIMRANGPYSLDKKLKEIFK